MQHSSILQTERDLIQNLEWLFQFRAAEESRLSADLTSAGKAADAAHARAADEALKTLSAARAKAEREFEQAVTRLEGEAGERLREADRVHALAVSVIDERAQVDSSAARRRMEDNAWMADTVLESALPKFREQYEKAKAITREQGTLLAAVRVRAEAAVAGLGAPAEWLKPSAAPALPEGDALGAVTPLVSAAVEQLRPLEVAPLLKVLRDRGSFGFSAALLALAAGGGAFVLLRGAGGSLPAGIGAGLAGLLVLGGLWAARSWAWGAVRRRVEPMGVALAAAESAIRNADEQAVVRRAEQEAAAVAKRDREVAFAKRQGEETLEELRAIHARHKGEAHERHAAAVADAETQRVIALDAARRGRDSALEQAEAAYTRATTHAEADRDNARRAADRAHAEGWSALEQKWRGGLHAARTTASELSDRGLAGAPAWSSDDAKLTAASVAPSFVPVGALTLDLAALPGGLPKDPRLAGEAALAAGPLSLPVGIEFPHAGSLAVRFGGASAEAGRAAALATLRVAMLRLLTGFPPGKVRFTIVDPVGLGESFAAFMHLADFDPKLVGDRIWTEPRHIEQRLADLTEHMETVIQKYLRNQYATIDDYNRDAGEIAEPYRFLVVADFPANFTEAAARRLASIAASGPRCGVHVLMALDSRQTLPSGVPEEDVLRGSVRLSWRQSRGGDAGRMVHDDPVFADRALTIEPPPDDARFNAIVRAVGSASKDAGRVRVPFTTITPPPAELWSRDSSADLRVAMGRAGATRLQELVLGRGTSQHALIAGRTGSGKSTLLHAVITNAALWYGPDQLELYLVDFKKGVEFKTYASHALAHARVIAVESEREFGLSVLRRLDAELKRRGELFRAAEVQDLAGFRRARPAEPMPRVMLIVDEFQELFVEDDRLAQEAGLLLDRLVRQGRAFGMHVVLGSQTLGGAYSLAKSTIGQMAVRIALQCSEQDSYLILSDDNAAARLLARPGEAIYNDASGAVQGNSPFQVAWLDDDERDRLLGLLADRVASTGARREAPIVFEGSVPADMARNPRLARWLSASDASAATGTPASAPIIYLGEPVAIKEPTAATFRRQAGANLLIVGQREDLAGAMLAGGLVALAAQGGPGEKTGPGAGPRLWVLDGTPADAPGAGLLARVAEGLPGGLARVVAYREVDTALAELIAELDRRLADADASPDRAAAQAPPAFVVIHGLQRFRTLRRPENEFDFSSGEATLRPDQHLARLLRDGPAAGLHVIATADTLAALNRVLDRQALREFDQRVLFQMSAADSSALIDAPAAGQLGQQRALLYSEEQGTIEKFRPYAPPDPAWLSAALAALRSR
jgi:S-DNA-T family DNA segregation ATPase FtsK/SpoIIIE